ncbi:hypothetical protein PoB_002630200 [Plakobranchus ocellatus]|uniref:Uncharacterized protein n=1 Tax=Plakobranchus ocellatus TaxID=259542 RepID=A0AAV3ZXJ1_9GAST|nr:hypothetical protein PoB_002630200 [Plakobranchus ocellatus]
MGELVVVRRGGCMVFNIRELVVVRQGKCVVFEMEELVVVRRGGCVVFDMGHLVVVRRGSDGSSGKAVGYKVRGPGFESQSRPNQFIIAPPCPPSTKWVGWSLKTQRKIRRRGKQ